MIYKKLYLLSLALLAVLFQSSAHGVIIFSGPLQSSGGSIEITSDVTFNITSTGTVFGLILDSWVTSDGDPSALSLSGPFSYSINAGPVQNGSVSFAYDNEPPYGSFGDVESNDGAIQLSAISVNAGDTLTVFAQTFNVVFGDSGWNPQAIQSFAGDVFLADFIGDSISDVVAVPEPSTSAILLSLCVLLATITRLRRLRY